MNVTNAMWLLSTVMLGAVTAWRARTGQQRVGSLIVSAAMSLAAACIVVGWETGAYFFQFSGLVVAGLLIWAERRWKRGRRALSDDPRA